MNEKKLRYNTLGFIYYTIDVVIKISLRLRGKILEVFDKTIYRSPPVRGG